MTKYFTFQDSASHKFWQIEIIGNKQIISFGRVGSLGTIKEKLFESIELCISDSIKLIKEKQKKGYLESQTSLKVGDISDPNLKIGQYLKAQYNSYKAKFLGLKNVHSAFSDLYESLEKFDIVAYKAKVAHEIEVHLKDWWINPGKGIKPDEVVYSILFEYDSFWQKDVQADAYGIVAWENFKLHTKSFYIDDYDFAEGFYAMPGITLNFFDELEKLSWQHNPDSTLSEEIGFEEIQKVYVFYGFVILNEVFYELGQKGIFKTINAKKGFMFMIGEHDMGDIFPIYTVVANT